MSRMLSAAAAAAAAASTASTSRGTQKSAIISSSLPLRCSSTFRLLARSSFSQQGAKPLPRWQSSWPSAKNMAGGRLPQTNRQQTQEARKQPVKIDLNRILAGTATTHEVSQPEESNNQAKDETMATTTTTKTGLTRPTDSDGEEEAGVLALEEQVRMYAMPKDPVVEWQEDKSGVKHEASPKAKSHVEQETTTTRQTRPKDTDDDEKAGLSRLMEQVKFFLEEENDDSGVTQETRPEDAHDSVVAAVMESHETQPHRPTLEPPLWSPSTDMQLHGGASVQFGYGTIAQLAHSSIVARAGETVVLSTVVQDAAVSAEAPSDTTAVGAKLRGLCSSEAAQLPLVVDYRERYHAAGRIPSNWKRRDTGPPTDQEILAARAVDRALRPLLKQHNSTAQPATLSVTCSVQSFRSTPPKEEEQQKAVQQERSGDPLAMAINAASVALLRASSSPSPSTNGITLQSPVACVRLCVVEEEEENQDKPRRRHVIVLDPTPQELKQSRLDLLYAGTRDAVVMVEFGTRAPPPPLSDDEVPGQDPGIPETVVGDLLQLAQASIQPLLDAQEAAVNSSADSDENIPDEVLAVELGLEPQPASNEAQTEVVEDNDLAGAILEEAFAFVEDKLRHVLLRLFGYNSDNNKGADTSAMTTTSSAFVHSDPSTLLSKSIRGRRERLVLQEVQRLLREDFHSSHAAEELWKDTALVDDVANAIYKRLAKQAMYAATARHQCRSDLRTAGGEDATRTLRPISLTVPLLPDVVHGSSLFSRGETQVLCTATLGAPREGQPFSNPFAVASNSASLAGSAAAATKGPYDDLPVGSLRFLRSQTALESDLNSRRVIAERELTGDSGTLDEVRRAFLHYDFPSYSTGEVQSGGSRANRREVGHGNLAEKAILPLLPHPIVFPYVIRLTSEVTGSNGSSSMASVCGATLALLDAGVPILAPAAGVSVGLAARDEEELVGGGSPYKLLLDITGTEDHFGTMDFKVAGTALGVTAMQLDVKAPLPLDVIVEALALAKDGRQVMLTEMEKQSLESSSHDLENLQPRAKLKPSAPRVEVVRFDPARKRDLIGPGGAVLKQLEDRFGVSLDLSQEGQCLMHGADASMVAKAKEAVMDLVADVEEGEVYTGTVIEIKDFGAIVELLRNKEGLLHVSELADDLEDTKHPEGNLGVVNQYLRVGQKVEVVCTGVDPVQGSIKLSQKMVHEIKKYRTY